MRAYSVAPRVLVCRTAWMDFYEGLRGDKAVGGGAYVEEHGSGHEVFNFRREPGGVYRGYVRPPGHFRVKDQRINIERLGAAPDDDRVQNVAVFWTATDPALGGTKVVGWYDKATVYRGWRPSPRKRLAEGKDTGFMVEAKKAVLIPSDDRMFTLPRATALQTGIGQSNVWYPPTEWATKLLRYRERVLDGTAFGKRAPKVGRTQDTEERLRIEREAMAATMRWCKERGLPTRDVSLKRVGWDIEAGSGKNILRIEVKGSSLPLGRALLELTPNEFAMMGQHRASFRLAVVSMAKKKPDLAMFRWSGDEGAWVAPGYEAKLHEVLSARVEVVER